MTIGFYFQNFYLGVLGQGRHGKESETVVCWRSKLEEVLLGPKVPLVPEDCRATLCHPLFD